ncbi:MAG: hypothetical protein E6K88_06120 [Thaumarchaeota archaeon]|nr:MAG: hypothetical protein E6K88_06120 [Nitrososphaerota archaeon]
MKGKDLMVPLVAALVAIISTVFVLPLTGGQNTSAADEGMTMMGGEHFAKGTISSVQLGSTGQPEWIQHGIWVLRIMIGQNNEVQSTQLVARFEMIKPDGTAMHSHSIYNFTASQMMMEGNSTNVLKGTATVTMKDGPVSDVPITIKVFNEAVIGFWIGPDKVSAHFGTGPVFGTLSTNSRAMMQEMHSLMQGMNNNMGGGSMGGGQNNSTSVAGIKMSAREVDGVYRWSTDAGINPTIKLVANTNNTIQIQNPTDEKHELVIESNGNELASSGDISAGKSGQLMFNATMTGTFAYHCEYHPDTMKGIIEVANS